MKPRKDPPRQTIGERIRQRRLELGLPEEKLALAVLRSAQAVLLWERGVNIPPTSVLPTLSAVLDLPLTELAQLRYEAIERRRAA